MARPEFLTEEDYAKRRVDALTVLTNSKDLPSFIRDNPPPEIVEATMGGAWLIEQVKAAGATGQQASDLAFALGQACFPARDPWKTAQVFLKQWNEGRAPKPGLAYADELLAGDVSELPKGGMRIVPARSAAGFTLVELLIVVAMIGLCTAAAIVGCSSCNVGEGQETAAKAEAQKWATDLGYRILGISCANIDSDHDGYVSCTVRVIDGEKPAETKQIECRGEWSRGHGCREPKLGVRSLE